MKSSGTRGTTFALQLRLNRKLFNSICTLLLFWTAIGQSSVCSAKLRDEAHTLLVEAQSKTLAMREEPTGFWKLPSYLGTQVTSLYYLSLKWTGHKQTQFDENRFKQILLSTQEPDGSWQGVPDQNRSTGILAATIAHYWVLKVMGVKLSDPALVRARNWIIGHGGLAQAPVLTQVMLATFGNASWDFLPPIPYPLFNRRWIFTDRSMPQWIGPVLVQIAYLKQRSLSRDLGARFNLDELRLADDPYLASTQPRFLIQNSDYKNDLVQIRHILERQQSDGSWGGNPLASLLAVIALEDFKGRRHTIAPEIKSAQDRGFASLEKGLLQSGVSAYLGAQDSSYWDTALIGGALLEAGVSDRALQTSARALVKTQNKNGGFSFGEGFLAAPDTDDTAEITLFLQRSGRFYPQVDRSMKWLKEMQNDDGGWGAFSKNNNPNPLISLVAGKFKDSADLFDDSSPDVTGHVLESLGYFGEDQSNSATARSGAAYLRETQKSFGAWQGRWGVTYLYGTCAAVVGLIKSGESVQTDAIRRAVNWVESKQNADGGWGETTLADSDPQLAGVGISSPTQTAWALITLLEAGQVDTLPVMKGIRYLITSYRRDGKWIDRSSVGTGHPGSFYMQYPSYAFAFPTMALARYFQLSRP